MSDSDEHVKTTRCAGYGALIKFILPLVITQMAPDIAEQALNRGITSIASEEMVTLLASFGLAYYFLKLLIGGPTELRQISMGLVNSKTDYFKMLAFCFAVSIVSTVTALIIGLTPAGVWLIRDLHQQPEEVTETAMLILCYLSPIPIIEGIANFHEGSLIYNKATTFAGAAKLVDFGMQAVFVVVFLFTPTRTNPVLIPVFAIYAGNVGRLILDVGFWLVLIRKKLPKVDPTRNATTLKRGITFWVPLMLVKTVQVLTRPIINLVVSRSIAIYDKVSAAKAVAVLTAVYPIGRFLFSWLNDLRSVIPAFYKKPKQSHNYTLKEFAVFSVGCTCLMFAINLLLFYIPGCAYAIMNKVVGLNEELAQMSVTPLRIFAWLCVFVGIRAHFTSYLLYKKKTKYLIPSAFIRLGFLILVLFTFPLAGLIGAELGASALLSSFVIEALAVIGAMLFLKYKSKFSCCKKKQENCEVEEQNHEEDSDNQDKLVEHLSLSVQSLPDY